MSLWTTAGVRPALAPVPRTTAVEPARSVSCVIILISTHAREDFEELIAGGPARGFLPKSALSARAIRELLDGDGQASAT